MHIIYYLNTSNMHVFSLPLVKKNSCELVRF